MYAKNNVKYARWLPINLLEEVVCSSSTPSQDVILCLHSMYMAKRQPGRDGTCAFRLQVSSPNSAAILQKLKKMTLRCWKSLLLQCMTDLVQLKLLIMHDWSRLPRSSDPTKLFRKLQQLLFSISDMLHIRQHVYGVMLWCASLTRRILLNGDGNKKETAGVMVCTPTICSEFLTADEMPVQDAMSRTVQMLQVWFELYDHVQLHLLRAQTSVYMESMNNAKLFIIEMTLYVHALLTCLLFVRFYYYACNMAE